MQRRELCKVPDDKGRANPDRYLWQAKNIKAVNQNLGLRISKSGFESPERRREGCKRKLWGELKYCYEVSVVRDSAAPAKDPATSYIAGT